MNLICMYGVPFLPCFLFTTPCQTLVFVMILCLILVGFNMLLLVFCFSFDFVLARIYRFMLNRFDSCFCRKLYVNETKRVKDEASYMQAVAPAQPRMHHGRRWVRCVLASREDPSTQAGRGSAHLGACESEGTQGTQRLLSVVRR